MLKAIQAAVLGPPGPQRARILLTLLTLVLYSLFALLQQAQVMLGFIDPQASLWLTAYYMLGAVGFYLLLRAGWGKPFFRGSSLVVWQMVHGILAVVWSYAITGPARGAVLAILVLILTYGMFALRARQTRRLVQFAVVVLGATMVWKCQTDPLRYPLWVEAVHLIFSVIVLLGVSALSIRMGALRANLRQQKRELEVSLERIRLLATQDELTGLVNRRHMTVLLQAEQARQQRTGQAMSLVLLDLDHFKRVNDNFGHRAGDIVLKDFSAAASRSLRASDVLARWGGEEFLLVLPGTTAEEALRCVERMRASLAHTSFDAIAPDLHITFSAGLSSCGAGDSLDAAIERADQAMYRAKAQGRNCTVTA
jgi:diguanylate cyclase (GGDEF)-like protein